MRIVGDGWYGARDTSLLMTAFCFKDRMLVEKYWNAFAD